MTTLELFYRVFKRTTCYHVFTDPIIDNSIAKNTGQVLNLFIRWSLQTVHLHNGLELPWCITEKTLHHHRVLPQIHRKTKQKCPSIVQAIGYIDCYIPLEPPPPTRAEQAAKMGRKLTNFRFWLQRQLILIAACISRQKFASRACLHRHGYGIP